jgi:signal peptidase I
MVDPPGTEEATNAGNSGWTWRLLGHWRGTSDWIKSLFVAFLVLAFVHVFVLRWVTVRSTSMYATLYPGDLVGVAKWPLWTGFQRGDVVVFRDPMQDDRAMARRQLLVKRIVGMPGDRVELRQGQLFVNGLFVASYPHETQSWLLRFKPGADPQALLNELGLPPAYQLPTHNEIELPLNTELADAVRLRPEVEELAPLPLATGSSGRIFPFSPNFHWNSDDYGPINVPKKGEVVSINVDNLALYDRLLSRYEGNKLEASGNDLVLNGAPLTSYTIRQDHFFVLGDSRHYSADSRYWGFVPADHLVGRASFVLMSSDPVSGDLRSGRWFRAVD